MQPLPAGPLPLVVDAAAEADAQPSQSWKRARGVAEGLARHWLLFALILLWQYISVSNPALALQLPPPTEILSGAWELIQKGTLQSDTLASLKRVGLALLAASLVGFPLGALLGASRRFAWSVEPVVNFFRPIPPLAWIPLSILWFGIADAQNEFIIFLAGVFPILLNTMEGVRDVDRQLVRAARTLGASRFVIAYSVVLPAALPQMFVGLRVGMYRLDGAGGGRAGGGDYRPGLSHQPGPLSVPPRLCDRRHGDDRADRPDAGRPDPAHANPVDAVVAPGGAMSRAAIEIQNVHKVYGSGAQRVVALNDVVLEISEQEFICVVGPSGCGKTTLLNIVAGFEPPSSGVVRAFDKLITAPGPDRTMMFQDYALFPWLSVRGNIEYGMKRRGIKQEQRESILRHYVELIDLKGFEDKYPAQLSGGMRQRVALARALAVNPAVLLMDEPFAALDSFTRERMQDELVRVWQLEKKAVLFITHNIDEAIKLADRVIVMSPRPGRISEVIAVTAPRPRDLDSEDNARIAHRVREILHLLPGAAAEAHAEMVV